MTDIFSNIRPVQVISPEIQGVFGLTPGAIKNVFESRRKNAYPTKKSIISRWTGMYSKSRDAESDPKIKAPQSIYHLVQLMWFFMMIFLQEEA